MTDMLPLVVQVKYLTNAGEFNRTQRVEEWQNGHPLVLIDGQLTVLNEQQWSPA